MAPKPKKEMTDAQKAMLKKMLSKGGNLDKDAKARAAAKAKAKPSTSYSPKPMSAFAKEKAAMAGATAQAKAKAAPRKALKRPTGELSKSNSSLAKFIKGSASGKGFTQAEARTAAGKFRDMANAKGGSFGSLDASGLALGKAEAATKKLRKTAAKPAARGAKAGSSTVSKVVKRAKTVAREVRDVKTAVGTSLRDQEQNFRRAAMGVGPTGKNVGKNLKTQIKEVGSAIKSGKKGTSSDMYNKPGAYKSGTKRK